MALGVTVAPFLAPEKPHLSPAAGARFGKDAISYTRADVRWSARGIANNLRAKPWRLEKF
jgi:hypothetical protein